MASYKKYCRSTRKKSKTFPQRNFECIFYVNKSGCQWRIFPSDFAPWQTVYYYFRKWKLKGIWEEIWAVIHSKARKSIGKDESSSLGIVDSRSVKTSHHVDTDRGIDGTRKSKDGKNTLLLILWDFFCLSMYMKLTYMTVKGLYRP